MEPWIITANIGLSSLSNPVAFPFLTLLGKKKLSFRDQQSMMKTSKKRFEFLYTLTFFQNLFKGSLELKKNAYKISTRGHAAQNRE